MRRNTEPQKAVQMKLLKNGYGLALGTVALGVCAWPTGIAVMKLFLAGEVAAALITTFASLALAHLAASGLISFCDIKRSKVLAQLDSIEARASAFKDHADAELFRIENALLDRIQEENVAEYRAYREETANTDVDLGNEILSYDDPNRVKLDN